MFGLDDDDKVADIHCIHRDDVQSDTNYKIE